MPQRCGHVHVQIAFTKHALSTGTKLVVTPRNFVRLIVKIWPSSVSPIRVLAICDAEAS